MSIVIACILRNVRSPEMRVTFHNLLHSLSPLSFNTADFSISSIFLCPDLCGPVSSSLSKFVPPARPHHLSMSWAQIDRTIQSVNESRSPVVNGRPGRSRRRHIVTALIHHPTLFTAPLTFTCGYTFHDCQNPDFRGHNS